MIAPAQPQNQQVKPQWQAPVGVMESVVTYNCRKYGMPVPILAMPLWEGAGNRAIDLSRRGNHGILTGQPEWIAEGLDYNGTSDYIDVGVLNGGAIGTNPRTISFQFNADAFGTGTERTLMTYAVGASLTGFWIFAEDGAVSVGFAGHRIISPKAALSTGVWYRASLVVPDGAANTGDTLIYIDGVNQSKTNEAGSSGAMNTAATNIKVGSDENISNFLDGRMRDVLIFDCALSQRQHDLLQTNPYFMYRMPEELYGYVSAAAGISIPLLMQQMNQFNGGTYALD